jgi:hypothetical protein
MAEEITVAQASDFEWEANILRSNAAQARENAKEAVCNGDYPRARAELECERYLLKLAGTLVEQGS